MDARYLVTNYISTASMLTVSSERAGQVGLGVKAGAGSATMVTGGQYTGTDPAQYIVEIDSVASGTGIGAATYRWRPTDTATWSASGVTTSTTAAALENGITVAWESAGGADFANGDYWTITVDKPFGKRMLLDRDRDTEWRSSGVGSAVTLVADLGTARAVDVVALCDHNLTSGATLTIDGNDADSWGAPALTEAISYKADNVLHYLATSSRTYRYWRLSLTDTANGDDYLRASELFLGSYTAFTRTFGSSFSLVSRAATYGPIGMLRTARGVWARVQDVEFDYRHMSAADHTALVAMFEAIYDTTYGMVQPVLVNLDTTDTSAVSLYELDQSEIRRSAQYPVDGATRYDWTLRLRQRPRIARSGS